MPKDTSSGSVVQLVKTGSRILTSSVVVPSCKFHKFYSYAVWVEHWLPVTGDGFRYIIINIIVFVVVMFWCCLSVWLCIIISSSSSSFICS